MYQLKIYSLKIINMEKAAKYWNSWVTKPEQEKYRGKELKVDEMWSFAEDYHNQANQQQPDLAQLRERFFADFREEMMLLKAFGSNHLVVDPDKLFEWLTKNWPKQ